MLRSATLSTRVVLTTMVTVIAAMVVFAAIMGVFQRSAMQAGQEFETSVALNVMTSALIRSAKLDTSLTVPEPIIDDRGTIDTLTWTALPTGGLDATLDEVTAQSRVQVSLLSHDAVTGGFLRLATSFPDAQTGPVSADVAEQIMTDLRDEAEGFTGDITTETTSYTANWVPIRDEGGTLIGALEAGMDTAAITEKLNSVAITSVAVIAVLAAIIYLSLAVALRRVMKPLRDIRAAMDAMSKGELDVDIPNTSARDDVGHMAETLRTFRESLAQMQTLHKEKEEHLRDLAAHRSEKDVFAEQRRVVEDIGAGLERLAQGDLTQQIESPGSDPFPADYDGLRQSYNAVLVEMGQTIADMHSTVDSVETGANEMHRASNDLASRAETQATTLEQSAAAINELTESVKSTSDRADQAETAGRDNRNMAENGAKVVRDAMDAMNLIESSSESVRRIIGVIDDIAFQTNLLALNAGVEAARAGDAGRGFAVVASEVRSLAQRASESATEINKLISSSAAHVTKGSQLVKDTGERLDMILKNTVEMQTVMSDIASAAREQALGIDEINNGVNQLDLVTQQTAAAAQEVNASSTSLNHTSTELSRSLGRFKVSRSEASVASPIEMPSFARNYATNSPRFTPDGSELADDAGNLNEDALDDLQLETERRFSDFRGF
ncbi:MAG: methyl-accepting chemotaxis protein [Pseudomonadota bacterium]